MIYIYDIVLNLNKKIIEFFEWEEQDNIVFVRKIPLFLVNTTTINDILNNDLKVNDSFLDLIKKKTIFKSYEEYRHVTLFTDQKVVVAVCFNINGFSILKSRLLLEEETDILFLSNKLKEISLEYLIYKKNKVENLYLTRNEEKIKKRLLEEINDLYKNNNIVKLNYYFFECFNYIENNKNIVYTKLVNSINNFDDRHYNLYKLMKLSYYQK